MEEIESRRGKSRSSLSNVTPLDFLRFMPLPVAAAPVKSRPLGGSQEQYTDATLDEAAALLGRVNLDPL